MLEPVTKEAMDLMQRGAIEFARMEANGIRIDVDYLCRTIEKMGLTIRNYGERLRADPLFGEWRNVFGPKTKLGSREQLAHMLFEVRKYECQKRTETGQPSADEENLSDIDLPFVRGYVKYQKFLKLRSTYLGGILRETRGGFIHPIFNLHSTLTYRSSSDHPNFQNQPKRDPLSEKIIRRSFIARPGRKLIEKDYSGAEVRCAACYHRDPQMLKYLRDPTTDMHRDMAAEIFCLESDAVTKPIRHCAKNMFVFPQFYGDFYINCAKNMWKEIGKRGFEAGGGISLYQHLKGRGIRKRGLCDPGQRPAGATFEKHMKEVEEDFWGKRFGVYNNWKKKWWESYNENGGFNTLTGFRIEGVFSRNQVINYPVQGSAFHWLLWALIRIARELRRRKMKTLLIGQIHDSLLADCPLDEIDDYIEISDEIMIEGLKRHFDWIITPIEVETEAGINWYNKEVVK